jgi:hypothetical protein
MERQHCYPDCIGQMTRVGLWSDLSICPNPDKEDAATWRLILTAIVDLQRERDPGEPLN